MEWNTNVLYLTIIIITAAASVASSFMEQLNNNSEISGSINLMLTDL